LAQINGEAADKVGSRPFRLTLKEDPSPVATGRCTCKQFGQPPRRAAGYARGRGAGEKKTGLRDFTPTGGLPLGPAVGAIDQDVVIRKNRVIRMDRDKPCRLNENDSSLLNQFAGYRCGSCFALFDAAAGKMPARNIGVAHQQNPAGAIDHHAADAEGQRPLKSPPGLKGAGPKASRHAGNPSRGAGEAPRRLRRSLRGGSGIEEAGSRLKEAVVASFYAIAIVFVAVSLLNLIEYRRLD
jgi:hypothetical protein